MLTFIGTLTDPANRLIDAGTSGWAPAAKSARLGRQHPHRPHGPAWRDQRTGHIPRQFGRRRYRCRAHNIDGGNWMN
jgi:hypothetical protein